ncbi:hypothetical protein [Nostoc phage A1]|nr:hypothetical protein [Nostoc phage A1]
MRHFLRMGTYTAISATTLLGIINPQFRLICGVLVFGYLLYAGSDTYKIAIEHYEEHRRYYKDSFIYAISRNALDIGCFVLSLTVAVFLAIA